ncbi:MAG: response regulator [bacterium]|nr:response regulator [bacterium]
MSEQLKKILIVEDEPDMRQALVESLKHEGFSVAEAANGNEGLERAIEHRPDLIVLDILMPKMGGMEMMKKLRNHSDWGQKVPIILLTNLSADDKIMRGIVEDEPSYYLVKSDWKIPDVVEKVREMLKKND